MVESIVPAYLGDAQQRFDEFESEVIKRPDTVAEMLAEYPERAMDVCNDDRVSVYLHDDLWFGLAIFDERICIGVLDSDTGACQALLDTAAPAARRWAEAVYESYKEEAVHLPRFDPFTLQQVVEEMRSDTIQRVEQR